MGIYGGLSPGFSQLVLFILMHTNQKRFMTQNTWTKLLEIIFYMIKKNGNADRKENSFL